MQNGIAMTGVYQADAWKSTEGGRLVPVKEWRVERFRELDRLIAEEALHVGRIRCISPGCDRTAWARGLCKHCWMRQKQHGVPIPGEEGAAAVARNQLPRVRAVPHARPLQGLKTSGPVSSSGEGRDPIARNGVSDSSNVCHDSSVCHLRRPVSASSRVLTRSKTTFQPGQVAMRRASIGSRVSCLLCASCFAVVLGSVQRRGYGI